jgi:hypothetical protein
MFLSTLQEKYCHERHNYFTIERFGDSVNNVGKVFFQKIKKF